MKGILSDDPFRWCNICRDIINNSNITHGIIYIYELQMQQYLSMTSIWTVPVTICEKYDSNICNTNMSMGLNMR